MNAQDAEPYIYADNAATTPLSPAALEAMMPVLTDAFGNPSGIHRVAHQAAEALGAARARIAELLGANRAGVTPLLIKPIRLAGNPGRYIRYAAEAPFRLLGGRRPFL